MTEGPSSAGLPTVRAGALTRLEAHATDLPAAVAVVVPGPPCAQGRGRAVRVGAGLRVVDPARSRSWKGAAQVHLLQAMDGRPLMTGPLAVEMLAVFALPKGQERRQGVPRRWHAKRGGDVDNLAKALLDAATGVVWADDSQVAELLVRKVVGAQGEAPAVYLAVRPLGTGPQALEPSHAPQEAPGHA